MGLLLAKGALDVLDLSETFSTPLEVACTYGKEESARFLFDNGADPNEAPKKFCATPLLTSIAVESFECMDLLLKPGSIKPLAKAALCGKSDMVEALFTSTERISSIFPFVCPLNIWALVRIFSLRV